MILIQKCRTPGKTISLGKMIESFSHSEGIPTKVTTYAVNWPEPRLKKIVQKIRLTMHATRVYQTA